MCHQQQLNSHPTTKVTLPTRSKAHYVDQKAADEAGIDTSKLGLFTIFKVNGRYTDPINITPEVNGTPIQMEVNWSLSDLDISQSLGETVE